ncbi:hypothetical protein B9Y88_07525 [Stenotrophomonas maltophilia]|uniref:hypothetical protein n=1 Tax=Stenotrophomonas TaxID=40323 RepID=UPI000C25C3B8|nr:MULTISPECIES: hypothetical protein [unclassified Stenotrophomonas]MCU1059701.1 hypothetical protein [Stenotrophomonas maltophilia]MDH1242538.1 hypothetical protein [Stenotrophomonas sp. GD03948]MDH1577114.1 hypothetical protein [Stenotrophomonas sp. GD03744]PJL78590.1 hypothetical protein B9Y88_07525 [Stenotrophomonas maltophilia]PZT38393.1 hypothetical protein A7X94_06395 [Stenotrophomonas maltophilia]
MAKKRVPLHQNPRGFVDVDPDATNGAQVGVNLRGPDGQILTAAQVINPTGGSSGGPSSIASTIWKLIREVPSNIQKLAALIGAGFAARQSNGDWALRSLQEGTGIDIANPDGDAGNPTIGLKDVANSGTGTLLAVTRDGKGRVTGTRPATITGTAQQIDVANGNAAAGMPTLELASEVLDSLGKADSAVQEVRPGANVTVDNTDPRRPIVSAMGTPDGYIDGFKLSYSGAGQVSVSSGNAYVPSVGGIVSALPSAPSVSVGTNAFGHVYLRADGSTEVDSTSPSAAYSGTARTKTGDSSCRYLGTVLTDSLGDVYMFMHVGAQITYMVTLENAPFRVLANGQQTTAATVSVASIVPTTSSIANFGITNIDAAVAALINSDAFAYTSNPNSFAAIPVPLDASNSFNYNYIVTPTGGLYVDCLGYYFER